jgi:asparagine synthase (glutamine-hydrolysing)
MTPFAAIIGPSGARASRPPVTVDRCQVWVSGYIAGLQDAPGAAEAALVAEWRKAGAGFQSGVIGEYAYALHDPDRASWVLGHDALGLRQLFVAPYRGGLALASRLEDLLDITGTGALDEDYIADMFASGAHYGTRTPFAAIRRAGPGEALLVDGAGAVRSIVTHRPTSVGTAPMGREPAAERLRELLGVAVCDALSGTGAILAELSGGLDSSSVACLAADVAPERCQYLSTVFSETPRADERAWIDVVRRERDLPWHAVDANRHPPFAAIPSRFQAEPSRALLLQSYYEAVDRIVDKVAREMGGATVLTGHGGDSVLFGDTPEPFFLADELVRRPWMLVRAIATWQRRAAAPRPFSYWLNRYALAPRWRLMRGRRVLTPTRDGGTMGWMARDYSARARLAARGREAYLPSDLAAKDAYFWERIRTSAFWLTTDIYQRPGAPTYRSPLLSLPLVEFMAALPWQDQLEPDSDRPLQRAAMVGILPEQTRLRRGKRGSDAALYLALRRCTEWYDLLTERPRLAERGYVDRTRWREAVDKARFGHVEDIGAFLWCCAVEAWLQDAERHRPAPAPWTRAETGSIVPAN